MIDNEKGPKIRVSISQKVNLGNYQMAEVQATMSDLPFDTDEQMLAQAQTTMLEGLNRCVADIRDAIASIRKEDGFTEEDLPFVARK